MKTRRLKRQLSAGSAVLATLTLSVLSGVGGAASSDLYPAVVQGDGALGYYRFSDSLTRNLINVNSGSLGAAGNASNDLATITQGIVYSMPGAIAGDLDRAAYFDFTTRTEIPYNEALNPPIDQPFTLESWIYPVSDQANNGMGVWCNRYTQGATRQGWVMYQRGANTNTSGFTQGPGVGWDFRMYNNQDTSGHLEVTSGVPFTLGKWQHVVVVYEPMQITNATLIMYIDGVAANTNVWGPADGGYDGVSPGYYPCQSTNAVQPNGPPAIALGGYNNSNGGTAGFENPWIGGIDEFAFYPTNLSPAQILAHYQNATNVARTVPYPTLIKSENPVVYLRLDEVAPGPDTAFNIGDARGLTHALTTPAVKHPGASALAGRIADASHSGHYRDTSATGHALASIPWTANNNPDASIPFSVELWARPTGDQMNPGPAVVNNRVANGITDRTGWVIYQRDPNSTYTGSISSGEGIGYTFRMYTGTGGGGQDVVTATPYTMGQWQHLVITWEPLGDEGPSASGSEAYLGTETFYFNGVPVATNSAATYAANTNPTEDPANHPPCDLAIGSYNAASGFGEEFEGDIDEFVFYNNYVLTPDQVLTHYMNGTNSSPATNYDSLVFDAAGDYYLQNLGSTIPERTTIPQTYLRFNEKAYFPAANSGSLGALADASLVMTTNLGTGPAGAGFAAPNPAVPVDGATGWVSLNNPAGLNISGQVTLEAWINPAAAQGSVARILSHGPPTHTIADLTLFPSLTLTGSLLSSNEVYLRLETSPTATNYVIGTSDGTTFHGATATVPASDLGGGQWIHLAGTYDGAHWNLYRNGVQVASVADAVGALPVSEADWAIGSTGMGWADFFAGGIDEAAIYNVGLAPAIVKAHYYVGESGSVTVTTSRAGSNVSIVWPAGILQQADAVTGPYTDLPSANSPYPVPSGTTHKFYRARL